MSTGEKLDGEWNGSAYPDYGIYTYANGDRYGGSWKQGKKHGIGTYYFASGAKYQGMCAGPHRRSAGRERGGGGAGLSAPQGPLVGLAGWWLLLRGGSRLAHAHTPLAAPHPGPRALPGEYKDGEPHGNAVFLEASGKVRWWQAFACAARAERSTRGSAAVVSAVCMRRPCACSAHACARALLGYAICSGASRAPPHGASTQGICHP